MSNHDLRYWNLRRATASAIGLLRGIAESGALERSHPMIHDMAVESLAEYDKAMRASEAEPGIEGEAA